MQTFLVGFGWLMVYFVVCASSAVLLRRLVQVEREVFRKILHCILLGSLMVLTHAYTDWRMAAMCSAVFAAVVYPALACAEKIKGYSQLLTERKKGEIKNSLLVVFGMFAIVISVCWGWLGDRLLAVASVYAWGFGDAAAALVGTRYGKHPITGKHIHTHKSAEGSGAMFAVSFACVLAVLLLRGGLQWYGYLTVSALTAAASAAVELLTPDGMDTITCPLAAMTVLIVLLRVLGGLFV